jgi:hypothetical protein
MSQQMLSFDVINLAASQVLLRHLAKSDVIEIEQNWKMLRVFRGSEIGCVIVTVFFV